LCQIIVHLGYLSAQTYIWEIAKEWEQRIADEFKNQTIKEEKVKIPVREWMAKMDIPTRYKNQHFFIEHVVKPLWQPATHIFPEINERLESLASNSRKYLEIADKEKSKTETKT